MFYGFPVPYQPMATEGMMLDVKDSTEQFAAKLTALIRRWPGSQRELAAKLEVSPQMLNQYMRGSIPRPLTLIRLSRELQVPLEWLLDEKQDWPPPSSPDAVKGAPYRMLIGELKRQYEDLVRRLNPLLDRAERVPWEYLAIWLLRQPRVIELTPVVESCLSIFKGIDDIMMKFGGIAAHAMPSSSLSYGIEKGIVRTSDHSHPLEIEQSINAIRRERPGWLGVSYYVCNFDADFMARHFLSESSESDWNDRRAWLLARIVTHPSVNSNKSYDKIRKRLHQMRYIDDEGKPRDFGDSSMELGSFVVDPPQ